MIVPHQNITPIPTAPKPPAIPSLWNERYDEIDENFAALDAALQQSQTDMAEHLAATDPHPQYLTPLEGDARYPALVHGHTVAEVAGAAPLASPVLTGTPTAPTAGAGTNTTQLATTAFVATAIANLIASSPAELNTLNELATALGNDPNFATTITNALAAKAPLASPALTGTPSAPTAPAGTNTTQLATTAFVAAAVAAAGGTTLGNVVGAALAAAAAAGVATTAARSDHVHPYPTPAQISAAPIASPALTGTPTAPTAGAGTNTTQLATTAFVATAIANLIASSPAALNTLNELATALGNDPNFATTITNALAGKVATVGGQVGQCTVDGTNEVGYRNIPQNSQSAAYTCVLTDKGKHIFHPSADTTARTFTIPANASVAYHVGTAITFVNQNGAGALTIAITTDTLRLAGSGSTGSRVLAANGIATALKVTATEWLISGTGLS